MANTSSSLFALQSSHLVAVNPSQSSRAIIQDQWTTKQPPQSLITGGTSTPGAKGKETERKYLDIPPLVTGKGPPSSRMVIPPQFAHDMLLSFRYIPLWYFIPHGRQSTLNSTNDPSQAVRDEDLTWEDVFTAKTRMLNCLHTFPNSWPEDRIQQLEKFYSNLLDYSDSCTQGVVLYQAQVRREWYYLSRTSEAFDISAIDYRRLGNIITKLAISITVNRLKEESQYSSYIPQSLEVRENPAKRNRRRRRPYDRQNVNPAPPVHDFQTLD